MLALFSLLALLLLLTLSFGIEFAISPTKHPHLCHENERSALLQFNHAFSINKSATIDALNQGYADPSSAYPKTRSWNNSNSNSTLREEGDDCCRWDGVECDHDTGHVVTLDLSAGCLYGSIDSSSTLFRLVHLRQLNLAYNYFNYSRIPSQIGLLSRLTHLNLSQSSFSGPIPTQISELSHLVELSLFGNPLLWLLQNLGLGGLVRNLTSIQKLHLSGVNISSTVPDSLADLSSLQSLVLIDCGLHGQFPANIFNLRSIRRLVIAQNQNLRGFLPEFKANSPLRILMLLDTSFSGEIPNSIGNLHALESLTLGNSKFVGSIPESLSNLTQLTRLLIADNNFREGMFPPWIGKLHQLDFLELGFTNLIGEIPPTLANVTRLSALGFGSNKLTGRIPSRIGNLTRLQSLDASRNALQGPVPNSIFELVNLKFLDISQNSLSGAVEFDKFVNLKNLKSLQLSNNKLSVLNSTGILNAMLPNFTILELASCNLSGFPDFLRTQNELQVLDLQGNNIGGQIPNWIWNSSKKTLLSVDLGYNSLTGFEQSSPIFLPLEQLQVLILRSNKLRGFLPIPPPSIILYQVSNNSFAGNLSPILVNLDNLQVLDVSNNNLHGTIPDSFKSGNQLRTINLSHNNLGGRLPTSLAYCEMLEILDIGNNGINDTFPSWLGILPELHILVLPFNRFHGTIGNFEAGVEGHQHFPSWNGMKLSDNSSRYLGSSITINVFIQSTSTYWTHTYFTRDSMMVNYKGAHISYANIPGIFSMIDISNNEFEGLISESIGDLRRLNLLNLSNNIITGSIPPSLGKLVNLESLDLSHNKLWKEIPEQLTQLTFLAFLNVSYNNLSGSIPHGQQFDTFLNSSYMGNTRLCGNPLPRKCGILHDLPNTKVEEEDSINAMEIDWVVVSMGFAGGLVFGLIVGTTLNTHMHEWYLHIFGRMTLMRRG